MYNIRGISPMKSDAEIRFHGNNEKRFVGVKQLFDRYNLSLVHQCIFGYNINNIYRENIRRRARRQILQRKCIMLIQEKVFYEKWGKFYFVCKCFSMNNINKI